MTTNKNHTMAAGIAGAAIGAAATAAVIALSDKEKRKKVEKALGDIKNKSVEQYHTLKSQADKTQKTVQDTTSNIRDDISEGMDDMRTSSRATKH